MNTEKLDALARAFMDIHAEWPQMSLDEWILEHFEDLTDTERGLGYRILRLYDEGAWDALTQLTE